MVGAQIAATTFVLGDPEAGAEGRPVWPACDVEPGEAVEDGDHHGSVQLRNP
jgi:hypothetical protein